MSDKEETAAVLQNIRSLHAFYWPKMWKGVDIGQYAEAFTTLLPPSFHWAPIFYILDGGAGFSLTDRDWLQRMLGIREMVSVKALAIAGRAYAGLTQIAPDEFPQSIMTQICDALWREKLPTTEYPSWGAGYTWRTSTGHIMAADDPSSLITALVGLAHIDAYVVTGERTYLERVRGMSRHLVEENGYLTYRDGSICFPYTPRMRVAITNSNAFVALFLRAASRILSDDKLGELSQRAYGSILRSQNGDGSWNYFLSDRREPFIDNYHTGFVIQSLLEAVRQQEDPRLLESAKKGIRFYGGLFSTSGAPLFSTRSSYPHDIHDVAQGIIVFSQASCFMNSALMIASRIADFANKRMKRADGRYSSRIYRIGRSNLSTPRWADSWMLLGFTEYLRAIQKLREVS